MFFTFVSYGFFSPGSMKSVRYFFHFSILRKSTLGKINFSFLYFVSYGNLIQGRSWVVHFPAKNMLSIYTQKLFQKFFLILPEINAKVFVL